MYQLTINADTVINLDDGSYVSVENGDYQDWLAAGNTPMPIPLTDLKQAKFDEINAALNDARQTGVPSRALDGTVYTYSIDMQDMIDFNAMVTASMLSQLQGQTTFPVLAMNDSNVWAFVQHNVAQVQQVAADVLTALAAMITKKQNLIDQIIAAQDADTINSISW